MRQCNWYRILNSHCIDNATASQRHCDCLELQRNSVHTTGVIPGTPAETRFCIEQMLQVSEPNDADTPRFSRCLGDDRPARRRLDHRRGRGNRIDPREGIAFHFHGPADMRCRVELCRVLRICDGLPETQRVFTGILNRNGARMHTDGFSRKGWMPEARHHRQRRGFRDLSHT